MSLPLLMKDIREQPQVLSNTLSQYLNASLALKMNLPPLDAKTIESLSAIYLTGSGSSYHSALIAKMLIEELAELPASAEPASEMRQRRAPLGPSTLVLGISSSGRSPDTMEALREARERQAPTLALVGAGPSPLADIAEGRINILAGAEKSPIATKTFTAQLLVLLMLALRLAQARGRSKDICQKILGQIGMLPELARHALASESQAAHVAGKIKSARSVLYLAHGRSWPLALEGALKLKETSRIHAEGQPAGELEHAGVSLLSPGLPCIMLSFEDEQNDSDLRLAKTVKERGAPLFVVTEEINSELLNIADGAIALPVAPPILRPLVATIPLQLLACHCALGQ